MHTTSYMSVITYLHDMELPHTKGHTSNPWNKCPKRGLMTTGRQIHIEQHYRSFTLQLRLGPISPVQLIPYKLPRKTRGYVYYVFKTRYSADAIIKLEQCEVSWIPLFTDDLLVQQVCMQVRSVMNINLDNNCHWYTDYLKLVWSLKGFGMASHILDIVHDKQRTPPPHQIHSSHQAHRSLLC